MRSDLVSEAFWASLGAFAGSLAPALDAVSRLNADTNPMNVTGLITVIISAISLGVVVLSGVMWRNRARHKADLLNMIRNRPRAQVVSER